jgi:threonine synthase
MNNTIETMRRIYEDYEYVLDPHGAVGFYALEKYLEKTPEKRGFFLKRHTRSNSIGRTNRRNFR